VVGRATGRPVHALLGERRRDRVPILAVIAGGDLAGDLRDAATKKDAGFSAFKIKVGVEGPAQDAARTRSICETLGPGLLVCADANQGFSRQEAGDFMQAVAGAGLAFLEQPVRADDLAGMAAMAAAGKKAGDIAVAADEGIHGLEDITRHHDAGAAQGVGLKAIKLGGLRAVVEAGRLCERLGLRVNLACKTGESSIACAAALHAAAVLPDLAWCLTLTNGALAADVTAQPLRVERGHAEMLNRPGLGIEVDEARLRRYRITPAAREVA
jgi:muconate cycloisomerase